MLSTAGSASGMVPPSSWIVDGDHFGDSDEMILHPLAAVETGGAGQLDDGLEIPVVLIAKHLGKIPAGPEFVARRIRPADSFKGG